MPAEPGRRPIASFLSYAQGCERLRDLEVLSK